MSLADAPLNYDSPTSWIFRGQGKPSVEIAEPKGSGNAFPTIQVLMNTATAREWASPSAIGKQSAAARRGYDFITAQSGNTVNYPFPNVAEGVFNLSGYAGLVSIGAEQAVATEMQLQQLRRDFEGLASEVRKIASALPASLVQETVTPRAYSAKSLELLAADLGVEFAGDEWVELFDCAAASDAPIPNSVLEAARTALKSDDPAVRSVAGRTLAASGSAELIEEVRAAIESEKSSLVARTLRSAIKSSAA